MSPVQEALMPLGQEVRQFVSGCERIHGFLAGGGALTADEREVLEMATTEVLAKIRPANETVPPGSGLAVNA
jgi:hypothetical protein